MAPVQRPSALSRSSSSSIGEILSPESVQEQRTGNFVKVLSTGGLCFVAGVAVGFLEAVYHMNTHDLALAISVCLAAATVASLRLPIVYHLFIPEPPTSWHSDDSWSLYLATSIVGGSIGLALPAEFILIELCMNDPEELSWERGGWVCLVALAIPVAVGLLACVAEIRGEEAEREKWNRIRMSRMNKGSDRVVLMMDQGDDSRL